MKREIYEELDRRLSMAQSLTQSINEAIELRYSMKINIQGARHDAKQLLYHLNDTYQYFKSNVAAS